MQGGCLCGQFRYDISGAPIAMFNCHCRDCQQSTGSAYAPVVYVSKYDYKVVHGQLRHYYTDSSSGGKNMRGFCPDCGARVSGGESDEAIGILAASLDDPAAFLPQRDFNIEDAQSWDLIPAERPRA